ncbi:LuxR C-terminal-related transcriptional regulator [uncultured Psychrosphaera sp.]|uniref:helix-turn-helix transcriptional regulator n=1 Tax=uncultured Psychrosphaera sp. TaxID=1403522 RepID=UPI0030F68E9A
MSYASNKTAILIKDIYKLAYQTPVTSFKDKVFYTLKPILEIDAGTWITRGETDAHFYESDAYTFCLPDGFIQEPIHFNSVSEQIQNIYSIIYNNPGRTFDILDILTESEWYNSELYQLYCKKYQLSHSLMTTQIEPHNQVVNLVTYARHDADKIFTSEEKQLSEWVQPCLVDGLKINLLNQFQHQNKDAFYGVFDTFGHIIEAEDSLISLLQQSTLLQGAHCELIRDNPDCLIDHQGLMIQSKSHEGLILVEVMKSPLSKQLSSRQLDICHHLIAGKSNKEIAKALKLAPNTVNNHLKRIFNILNVTSRHQAIGYLMRQDILQ